MVSGGVIPMAYGVFQRERGYSYGEWEGLFLWCTGGMVNNGCVCGRVSRVNLVAL